MKRMAGQVAIVTGGAGGDGATAAMQLAEEGATVVIWDQDDRSFGQLGFRPDLHDGPNLHDMSAVQSAAKAVIARFDKIDILVNCARLKYAAEWDAGSAHDRRRSGVEVDLTAAYVSCQAVQPFMRMRGFGRIVNVARSIPPNAIGGNRIASANELIELTKCLARELRLTGVTVNAVVPAARESAGRAHSGLDKAHAAPGGRAGTDPQDLSEAIAFAASVRWSGTTGFTFDVGHGRALY